MPRATCCRFCRNPLDPATEFAYLVELQTLDNPAMLDAIRTLPHAGGRPLRVCRPCQSTFEAPAGRSVRTVAAALGLLALGAAFGHLFTGPA